MSATTTSGTDRKLLAALRRKLGPLPIALVLRDTRDVPETSEPIVATVRFQDRPALLSLAKDPDRGFGDAYSAGRVEVDGDLVRSLECVYLSRGGISRWHKFLLAKWLDWLQNNTRRGSRANIHHHYDLSNDFYRLWLDERMLYTCAYFPTLEASLEAAQEAKREMVCRK